MRKKAKIFSPDTIKDKICQAVLRDTGTHNKCIGSYRGVFDTQLNRLGFEIDKKYVSSRTDTAKLAELAYRKFLNVNEHMLGFGQEGLDLPPPEYRMPQSRYSARHNVLLRARAICKSVLSPFTEDEWFLACKHGNGSSLGVPFVDTSVEAKSRLPMTVTKSAAVILDRYHNFDSQLKLAIENFNQAFPVGNWYDIVNGSRATTVPKSKDIDRMIAIEPTGNMFLQQGLMRMMYDRFRRCGWALETLPTMHRARARHASITSNEATIDWSSASDCVSIELLRWLIPPMWFECCELVRSPSISVNGDDVELAMFSTMGNAVTFPLETLVFYSLAHAVRLQSLGTLDSFPEWEDRLACSVFGDDCIVPANIAQDFIQIMESVGFIVNADKTFIDDRGFRESCGGDYFRGCDTRPFYLKGPIDNRLSSLEPWLYIIGNRLIAKYMLYFGTRNYMYGKQALEALFGCFQQYNIRVKIVPEDFPDDAGLKIMNDFERFDVNYRPTWSRIGVSQQGLYDFRFCMFRYTPTELQFEDLHYAIWLKRRSREVIPESRDEQFARCQRKKPKVYTFVDNLRRLTHLPHRVKKEILYRPRKQRGGYVVASAETAHWDVTPSRMR